MSTRAGVPKIRTAAWDRSHRPSAICCKITKKAGGTERHGEVAEMTQELYDAIVVGAGIVG